VYWDKVSGIVPIEERKAASRLLADAKAGKIDYVEVHSIDRLDRSVIDVLQTIKTFTELEVLSAHFCSFATRRPSLATKAILRRLHCLGCLRKHY
jgi:hypothetical protein